jgi:ankyrin repeat protein
MWRFTKLLLEAGADVHHVNRGYSPLTLACLQGYHDSVVLLLQSGADVEVKPPGGETSLIRSVRKPHCLILLLQAHAKVDRADDDGMTALMRACKAGQDKSVEVLLAYGAITTIADTQNMTALMYACEKGYDQCVSALLDAGTPVDQVGPQGKTAVWFARQLKFPRCMQHLNMRPLERRARVLAQKLLYDGRADPAGQTN